MRLDLNASYFKTKIIEASALGKLSGNDVFKEYFRGCILKLRSQSSPSAMALLDFKRKITIKYKVDTSGRYKSRKDDCAKLYREYG
jgi:hypothetical protein